MFVVCVVLQYQESKREKKRLAKKASEKTVSKTDHDDEKPSILRLQDSTLQEMRDEGMFVIEWGMKLYLSLTISSSRVSLTYRNVSEYASTLGVPAGGWNQEVRSMTKNKSTLD